MICSFIHRTFIICIFMTALAGCNETTSTTGSNTQNTDISDSIEPIDTIDTSGVVTLNWTPPTENTDGSSLLDLTGYKIYYGISEDDLSSSIIVDNPGLTSYVLENLDADTTYYFVITAVNSENLESDLSNIESMHINS